MLPELVRDTGLNRRRRELSSGTAFLELRRNQPLGQQRREHRYRKLRQYEGQRTDVVLVPVGDEYAANTVSPFHQVGNVRDYEVDAQHSLLRELDAAVYDDNVVAEFEGHHVLADFPQPSQGNDAQFFNQDDFRSFQKVCRVDGALPLPHSGQAREGE